MLPLFNRTKDCTINNPKPDPLSPAVPREILLCSDVNKCLTSAGDIPIPWSAIEMVISFSSSKVVINIFPPGLLNLIALLIRLRSMV